MEQVEKHQEQLLQLIHEFGKDKARKSNCLKKYESIIMMVHTLVIDKRLHDLDKVLQKHFAEYYSISK